MNGKKGGELFFEIFVGAAFGAVGGQFGGALSKAFATQFLQSRAFAAIASSPTFVKYAPRLVYAIPNTVQGIGEDLTKGFGTGGYREPGFGKEFCSTRPQICSLMCSLVLEKSALQKFKELYQQVGDWAKLDLQPMRSLHEPHVTS